MRDNIILYFEHFIVLLISAFFFFISIRTLKVRDNLNSIETLKYFKKMLQMYQNINYRLISLNSLRL